MRLALRRSVPYLARGCKHLGRMALNSAVAQIPGTGATHLLEQAHDAASSEARSWIEPLLVQRHAAEERISA